MRKYLLSVIIILSSLSANAQSESDSLVSLAKVNFLGITEFAGWSQFDDTQPEGKIEVVDDGLAITNDKLQSQSWQPQVMIVPDGSFDLKEGHNYVVRLTIKVPSDGQYMLNIGTWSDNSQLFSSVKARDDFQIIDVEYPEYKNSVSGCHVLLGCGWVVGTTILKEVEVLEKTSTAGVRSAKPAKDADDTIYNLSGQKVNASYTGIVISKGRKIVK